MATYVYLSNDPSDVSGYLKAYINGRSPNASTTASTAVTNTSAGTSGIPMTLTAGGSAAKWLTVPIKEDVTISTTPFMNAWGLESNASANAKIAFAFHEYTTSQQSAFFTSSTNVELTTSSARVPWLKADGETLTGTTIEAGNRLAILPIAAPQGTMGGSQTVTMSYNGSTSNAAGDTYVVFNEAFEAGQAQVGSGDTPGITGVGVSYFYNIYNTLQTAIDAGLFESNTTVGAAIDEATDQSALV